MLKTVHASKLIQLMGNSLNKGYVVDFLKTSWLFPTHIVGHLQEKDWSSKDRPTRVLPFISPYNAPLSVPSREILVKVGPKMLKLASDMLEVLLQAPSVLKGKSWSCCTSCPVLSFFVEEFSVFKDSSWQIWQSKSAAVCKCFLTFVVSVSPPFDVVPAGCTAQTGILSPSVIPPSDFFKVGCWFEK